MSWLLPLSRWLGLAIQRRGILCGRPAHRVHEHLHRPDAAGARRSRRRSSGLSRFSRDARQGLPAMARGISDPVRRCRGYSGAETRRRRRQRFRQALDPRNAEGERAQSRRVSDPRTLADVRDQIRQMGALAGHPERAAAEIARLDAAIAARKRAAAGKSFSHAAAVTPRLGSRARQFCRRILAEAGLASAAGELGVDFGGFVSMEEIVSLKPDFLVVSDAGDRAEDDGQRLSAASGAGALLSARQAHRHSRADDRMRRCASGGRAECADD